MLAFNSPLPSQAPTSLIPSNKHSPAILGLTPITASDTSNNTKTKYNPTTLLAKQRLNRPVSPHLSIYRPQITWTVSIATRITGIILSGGLYLYATAHALSPVTGWDVTSDSVLRKFGEQNEIVKTGLKTLVAWPFLFHCLNGVRHLVWDTGVGLNNRAVTRSGWGVVGVSVSGGVILGLYRGGGEE
ncbi:hypothetical protein BDW69DRAFT_154963 [Aspergillus filifer]